MVNETILDSLAPGIEIHAYFSNFDGFPIMFSLCDIYVWF